jgi:hypothetical protein
MDFNEETVKTVQDRLDILPKNIGSEENYVIYYKTLWVKKSLRILRGILKFVGCIIT